MDCRFGAIANGIAPLDFLTHPETLCLMEQLDRSAPSDFAVTTKYCRSFGFVFCAVCVLGAVWPMLKGGESRLFLLAPAAVLLLLALARPNWLSVPAGIWMKFGFDINRNEWLAVLCAEH